MDSVDVHSLHDAKYIQTSSKVNYIYFMWTPLKNGTLKIYDGWLIISHLKANCSCHGSKVAMKYIMKSFIMNFPHAPQLQST